LASHLKDRGRVTRKISYRRVELRESDFHERTLAYGQRARFGNATRLRME
jgi:hypothetical protein